MEQRQNAVMEASAIRLIGPAPVRGTAALLSGIKGDWRGRKLPRLSIHQSRNPLPYFISVTFAGFAGSGPAACPLRDRITLKRT